MEQSPKFLLIESSGDVCSVAIAYGKEVVAEKSIIEPNSHSTYLASFVQDVLTNVSLSTNELSAVVIGGGPGSYTGLRIGASLAKGICFGSNIPLISTSTLLGLATSGIEENPDVKQIVSLIDARRMDAYVHVFDSNLTTIINEHFRTLDQEFIQQINSDIDTLVVGSGGNKWIEIIHPNSKVKISESKLYARHLLGEALIKWEEKDFEDVVYYEPNYIKSVFVTKPKPKF